MPIFRSLLGFLFILTLFDTGAEAASARVGRNYARLVEKSHHMREARYRLAPLPFVRFCMEYPKECRGLEGETSVELTDERMSELVEVNHQINARIQPEPDMTIERRWKLDVTSGDCNAYAVAKRHELIERGWPARSLSLAVVITPEGEGHLVLTVRSDRGDLVLDNLREDVVKWNRTGYDWKIRQSAEQPLFWVEVERDARV